MDHDGIDNLECPAPIIFTMIGGKWKLSILKTLIFRGPKRFGELRREVEGISQTMLTSQLRALDADGLIDRKAFAESPPRVEYSATEDGLALRLMFEEMHVWWLGRKRPDTSSKRTEG